MGHVAHAMGSYVGETEEDEVVGVSVPFAAGFSDSIHSVLELPL
jgi:hypothetical protein